MTDRRAERQALRDRELEAIRTGEKTSAQVRREREPRRARAKGTAARPPGDDSTQPALPPREDAP